MVGRVVAVGHAVEQGLLVEADAAYLLDQVAALVVAVHQAVAGTFDGAQAADALVAVGGEVVAVLYVEARVARRVALDQAIEGVVAILGDRTASVGAADDVAGGVVLEGGGAAVRADQSGQVAEAVVFVAGGDAARVLDLGEVVLGVVGELGLAAEMDDLLQRVRRCEALQQPEWGDPSRLRDVQAYLRGSPALIRAGDILALRATLARVARGEALVVQCGDCAEDMDDHHAENVARKAAVLELLAGALRLAGRRPVIRVGRIAGQYAKPRSKPHEQVGEQTLPVYRGDMVNGREAHAEQRRADPQRILKGYAAARNIMRHLGWDAASGQEANASPVWTSHEMLLLDYELSMLREDEQRRV